MHNTMNKYPEKIALWSYSDEKNPNLKAGATLLAASMTGGAPATLHAMRLSKKWSYPENISEKDQIGSGLTEKEFLKDHPDIAKNLEISKTKRGPFYAIVDGAGNAKVRGSYNHGITMHELGHIKDFGNGVMGVSKDTKARTLISRVAQRGVGSAGGLALAFHGAKNDNPTEAGLGMYLTHANSLYREGVANKHAYSAFKKYEGSAVANKFLKRIALHNTLNYHGFAAGEALAAAGITKLKKMAIDKRRERDAAHV